MANATAQDVVRRYRELLSKWSMADHGFAHVVLADYNLNLAGWCLTDEVRQTWIDEQYQDIEKFWPGELAEFQRQQVNEQVHDVSMFLEWLTTIPGDVLSDAAILLEDE